MVLTREFYKQNTLKIARELLGCYLVRKIGKKIIRAMITETEAYIGEDDLASHASKGRTKRTEIMYGESGHAYVYLIYGMYHCLNVVTEKKDFPAAVLIRGIKISKHPMLGKRKSNVLNLDGPGKLCRFLKINRKLNGWDLTRAPKQSLVRGKAKGDKLWIERGAKVSPKYIKKSKRIGIDYARHCKHYLWRFQIA